MKARILVIEDEMSINDLLCMNLEIAGYETVGYLDGNEAYCKLCLNGMPVPLLRNCYSIFNGTKYR